MAEILLEMRNITKTFPGVKALDNVNLKVEKGEIHALVGRTEPVNHSHERAQRAYIPTAHMRATSFTTVRCASLIKSATARKRESSSSTRSWH